MTNQEDLDFLLRIQGILEEHGHGTGRLAHFHDNFASWEGPVCAMGALAIGSGKLLEATGDYMAVEAECERFVKLLGLSYDDITKGLLSTSTVVTLERLMETDYYHNIVWWINDRSKEVITTKLNAAIERLQAEVHSEERELVVV